MSTESKKTWSFIIGYVAIVVLLIVTLKCCGAL